MGTKKKCFMISPIGDDQSAIRAEADALLWIAKNALEKYGFEVIRVDQIARPTVITSETIRLIQESELCLVVLTEHNPNVFYEAGRRHETGRPFIQLIRKDEVIPFDVAGIQTIIYDNVDSRVSVAKMISEIQQYVDEFEKTGYGSTGTGVSLSTIATSIDRVERKLGHLISGGQGNSGYPNIALPNADINSTFRGLAEAFKDPRELFLESLFVGNIQRAASALDRFEKFTSPKEYASAATMLAATRHEPAVEKLLKLLEDRFEELGDPGDPDDVLVRIVGTVASFYLITGRAAEAITRLEPIIKKILSLDLPPKAQASYKTQLQRLFYGMGEYEKAITIAEEVIQLDPAEPVYLYNASLTYRELKMYQRSADLVDRYMKFKTTDDDHLHHAVVIYTKTGRINEASQALDQLRSVSPVKSFAFDDEVRLTLGIKVPSF